MCRRHLYEAADIDGASFWHKTRHITIPMISPVIYFNSIMGLIGAFQVFARALRDDRRRRWSRAFAAVHGHLSLPERL